MYFGPLPTFIYKYQEPHLYEYLGGSIRFSIGETFNDIYDGEIYPGAESVEGIQDLKRQFIYCTSKSCHNNVMWGNYAENHKGFCIAYNPRSLLIDTNTSWADSIKYTDSPLGDDIDSLYGGMILPQDIDNPKCNPITLPHMVKYQFRKEKSWQYEEEFRLVLGDPNHEDRKFLDVPININSVEKIIFGFRADREFIENVMRQFANTNILFFKSTPSKVEYKITSDTLVYFKDDEVRYKNIGDFSKFVNSFILGAREDSINGKIYRDTLLQMKFGQHEFMPQLHDIPELTS